jgi:hypothetical protein
MSLNVWIGLIIQIAAVLLILWQVRERRLSHVGVYVVVMAFVVNGLTEVVQAIFPENAFYRVLVGPRDIDNWIVIGSIAILIFSVVYVIVHSSAKLEEPQFVPNIEPLLEALPRWQLVGAITLAGLVGVSISSQLQGETAYWIVGLTREFLIFTLVLTSLSYLMKNNGRNLVPVLVFQTVVAVLLSSRTAILVSSVLLVSALVRYRINIRWRGLVLLIFVGTLLMSIISASRYVVGREQLQGNMADRVDGLLTGGQTVLTDSGVQSVLQDFVYRFDGNAFPALVGAQFERGQTPVGLEPVQIDFFLMVPSFLSPSKLLSPDMQRNEAAYIMATLGLPLDVPFLAGTLGVLYGSFGAFGLWIVAGLFGFLFARIDTWLYRKPTLFGVLLGFALTYSALTMDVGLIWYFVNLRAILALYVFLKLLRIMDSIIKKNTGTQIERELFVSTQIVPRYDPHSDVKPPSSS